MKKRKIKKGNDFIYLWSIVRNGLPENLADAAAVTNRKLYLLTANDRVELTEYSIVDGNIVRVEFTPEIAAAIGDYRLELSYTVADDTLADKQRKCTIDVDAFQIVSKSALADDASEFAVTSDMAIGFKGDSAYTVWLSEGNKGTEADYLAYLQSPATEAIASVQEVVTTVSGNETLRAAAENTRKENETARVAAEGFRETAETTRSQNEASRVGAEELRVTAEATRDGNETGRQTAEALRVQAEQTRQTNTATAIQNAETATDDANSAADLANTKAGLADTATTNANTKAGLADTAATNANTKAGLADAAATNATNLVNTYAAELATKELKANKKTTLTDSDTDYPTTKAVNTGLALKEATANKQNNLNTDGTGTKFPTVDAVNAGLENVSVKLLASYTHSGNKEVYISSIDYATNTFTSVGHGLVNSTNANNTLMLAINRNELIYPSNVMPFNSTDLQTTGLFIVNATPDTFQLSTTAGGAVITLINKAENDLTKWHFEYTTVKTISITGLGGKINRGCKTVIEGTIIWGYAQYIGAAFSPGYSYIKSQDGAAPVLWISTIYGKNDYPVPCFGGSIIHTDIYTTNGHRKIFDISVYGYGTALNKVASVNKYINYVTPLVVNDNNKTYVKLEGVSIANGTNIKVYSL